MQFGYRLFVALATGAAVAGLVNGCASAPAPAEEAGIPIETIPEATLPAEPPPKATEELAKAPPAKPPEAEPAMTLPLVVYDTPSPNYDRRKLPISMIVLHYTATRNLSEAMNALRNPKGRNRVSCHYLVNTDGKIYRLVSEQHRAWHAGSSWWNGIKDVNSTSIGIEIVNQGMLSNGRLAGYPEAQIDAVIRLCRNIQARHHITDVVGHADIAPSRKQDPGENFPWKRLAKAGVGVWTDDFAMPTLPPQAQLTSIGYDASNYYFATIAFRRHYFPEGLTAKGIDRTLGRLAAVAELMRQRRQPSHSATTAP